MRVGTAKDPPLKTSGLPQVGRVLGCPRGLGHSVYPRNVFSENAVCVQDSALSKGKNLFVVTAALLCRLRNKYFNISMPSRGPECPATRLVIPAKLVLECFHRGAGIQGSPAPVLRLWTSAFAGVTAGGRRIRFMPISETPHWRQRCNFLYYILIAVTVFWSETFRTSRRTVAPCTTGWNRRLADVSVNHLRESMGY